MHRHVRVDPLPLPDESGRVDPAHFSGLVVIGQQNQQAAALAASVSSGAAQSSPSKLDQQRQAVPVNRRPISPSGAWNRSVPNNAHNCFFFDTSLNLSSASSKLLFTASSALSRPSSSSASHRQVAALCGDESNNSHHDAGRQRSVSPPMSRRDDPFAQSAPPLLVLSSSRRGTVPQGLSGPTPPLPSPTRQHHNAVSSQAAATSLATVFRPCSASSSHLNSKRSINNYCGGGSSKNLTPVGVSHFSSIALLPPVIAPLPLPFVPHQHLQQQLQPPKPITPIPASTANCASSGPAAVSALSTSTRWQSAQQLGTSSSSIHGKKARHSKALPLQTCRPSGTSLSANNDKDDEQNKADPQSVTPEQSPSALAPAAVSAVAAAAAAAAAVTEEENGKRQNSPLTTNVPSVVVVVAGAGGSGGASSPQRFSPERKHASGKSFTEYMAAKRAAETLERQEREQRVREQREKEQALRGERDQEKRLREQKLREERAEEQTKRDSAERLRKAEAAAQRQQKLDGGAEAAALKFSEKEAQRKTEEEQRRLRSMSDQMQKKELKAKREQERKEAVEKSQQLVHQQKEKEREGKKTLSFFKQLKQSQEEQTERDAAAAAAADEAASLAATAQTEITNHAPSTVNEEQHQQQQQQQRQQQQQSEPDPELEKQLAQFESNACDGDEVGDAQLVPDAVAMSANLTLVSEPSFVPNAPQMPNENGDSAAAIADAASSSAGAVKDYSVSADDHGDLGDEDDAARTAERMLPSKPMSPEIVALLVQRGEELEKENAKEAAASSTATAEEKNNNNSAEKEEKEAEKPAEEDSHSLPASSAAFAVTTNAWKPLVKKKVYTPLGDRILDEQEEAECALAVCTFPLYSMFFSEIRLGRRRWLCSNPVLVSRVLTFAFGGPLPSGTYPAPEHMIELSNRYCIVLREYVVAAVLLAFLSEGDLMDNRHPILRILSLALFKRHFEKFEEFALEWRSQAALHTRLSNPRAQHAFRTPCGMVVSGAFDGGNLAHVEQHPGLFGSPPVYQMWLTPDAEMVAGLRYWFHVTLTNIDATRDHEGNYQCICVRIMNAHFREHFAAIESVRPVWCPDHSPNEWRPVAEARLDYEHAATDCKISFYIPPLFPEGTHVIHIAWSVPYNASTLVRSILRWDSLASMEINKKLVRFETHFLCKSTDGRPIYTLELSGSQRMMRRRQRSIWVVARANAADSAASHALNGMIDWLLMDRSYSAKHVRENFNFFFLPMVNPDGIARGHSRLDGHGENLNTQYSNPHPKRHPAQEAFERKLWKLHKKYGRPAMFLDLQAQVSSTNAQLYGAPASGSTTSSGPGQHAMMFARAFAEKAPAGTFSVDAQFLPATQMDEVAGSSWRHFAPHVEHCYSLYVPTIYDGGRHAQTQRMSAGQSGWTDRLAFENQLGAPDTAPALAATGGCASAVSAAIPSHYAAYGRALAEAIADITGVLMRAKGPPERPPIPGKRFGRYIKEFVIDPDASKEMADAREAASSEEGIQFFSVAKSQMERDYVLLIDRSKSMSIGTRWADTENAVSMLAPQICMFDPDGITIIFFDHEVVQFDEVQTAEQVRDLFARHPPRGATDLALALDGAFEDFFSGYRGSTSILVLTDGRPGVRGKDAEVSAREVREVIIEAANTLEDHDQYSLSISFIQIGENEKAREFLVQLDDELGGPKGARFDIVDTVTCDDLKNLSFNELVAKSLLD